MSINIKVYSGGVSVDLRRQREQTDLARDCFASSSGWSCEIKFSR